MRRASTRDRRARFVVPHRRPSSPDRYYPRYHCLRTPGKSYGAQERPYPEEHEQEHVGEDRRFERTTPVSHGNRSMCDGSFQARSLRSRLDVRSHRPNRRRRARAMSSAARMEDFLALVSVSAATGGLGRWTLPVTRPRPARSAQPLSSISQRTSSIFLAPSGVFPTTRLRNARPARGFRRDGLATGYCGLAWRGSLEGMLAQKAPSDLRTQRRRPTRSPARRCCRKNTRPGYARRALRSELV